MMQFFYSIHQWTFKEFVDKTWAWGVSAFAGVLFYLKSFPMDFHMIGYVDWSTVIQYAKVLAVALATGFVGHSGKLLAERVFGKKKKDNP